MKIQTGKFISLLFISLISSCCYGRSNEALSLLAQELANAIDSHEISALNLEGKDSDLLKNAYLPINLQTREHAANYEQSTQSIKLLINQIICEVFGEQGYSKWLTHSELSNELRDFTDKNLDHVFRIYGDPKTGHWGFKLEGYHFSLTFLLNNHEVKFVNFLNGQDFNLLNQTEWDANKIYNNEAKIGAELINTLSARQLKQAYLSINTPNDIMTNPHSSFLINEEFGLSTHSLNKEQRKVFISWVESYMKLFNSEINSLILKTNRKRKFYDGFHIIWSGHLEADKDLYFLIYNDDIIIEHSFNEGHLHTAVRLHL